MMFEQNICLLLIEDNPGDIDLIRAILQESMYVSFQVESAIRLTDGLNRLRQPPPVDIILLDLNLPDSQGLETARTVRAAFPNVPIVVLTSLNSDHIGLQAIQLGVQDYVAKDRIEVNSLIRTIRYSMERHQLDQRMRQQRDLLAQLAEERARLVQLEQAARAQAEEANERKAKFIAMVSHELRTPLTSMKGFASTLLVPDLHFSAADRRGFLEVLKEESEKIENLVGQLIDVSSLQAGVFQVEPQCASLRTIIERTMVELNTLTARHNLRIDIPAHLPDVAADEQRIGQVLINLVHNATKYAPPATAITLSARDYEPDAIKIEITDKGSGIPEELRDTLFEPFRKADQFYLNKRDNGMGLGLAICRGIVESHHGKIWIDDSIPQGTIISFTLPVFK